MPLDPGRLARVHRVRTLQLGLAQAEEARARDTVASEAALAQRIAAWIKGPKQMKALNKVFGSLFMLVGALLASARHA